MSKITLYIASTVDGYIADQKGNVDFLDKYNIENEDYGYQKFYDSVDCLVLGSTTYKQCLGFPDWPYPDKQVVVFSDQNLQTPYNNIKIVQSKDLIKEIAFLKSKFSHIWLVGGGKLACTFLQKNLLDSLILSIMPEVLGQGVKLFGDQIPKQFLQLQNFSFLFPSFLNLNEQYNPSSHN
jgi:dihydrofolate reductase